MKTCIDCQNNFEENNFKRCGRGFAPYCNNCLNKRMELVRSRKTPINPDEKLCKACGEIKLRTEYHHRIKGEKAIVAYCKKCTLISQNEWRNKNREKVREQDRIGQAKRRKENPERYKNNHFKYKYGITLDQIENMKINQNNKCAICGQGPENKSRWNKLFVDHCHDTGKVRKLLCGQCNAGLGNFQENKEFLNNAIEYLDEHKS